MKNFYKHMHSKNCLSILSHHSKVNAPEYRSMIIYEYTFRAYLNFTGESTFDIV